MLTMTENNEILNKIDKIRETYRRYTEEIKKLQLRQEEIVLEYIKRKEKEEISKIQEKIKNNYQ
jgi:GTP-binding protein EngB required for normal cell division